MSDETNETNKTSSEEEETENCCAECGKLLPEGDRPLCHKCFYVLKAEHAAQVEQDEPRHDYSLWLNIKEKEDKWL